MNILSFRVKKLGIGIIAALLFFTASLPTSFAQSYYYPTYTTYPTYSSTADQQALLSQLYALLAQLQAMQGYTTPYYGAPTYTTPVYSTPTYTYTTYSNTNYDVTVQTEDIDARTNDSVFVTGRANLNSVSYAYVWFEYGENGHITEKTDRVKIAGDISFSATIDNLDDKQQYYVRAVAEDAAGSRSYGSLRGFEIHGSSNNNNSDDEIPDVTTSNATNINSYQAELRGSIAMNGFDNGIAFFVYGEDEDEVESVENDDSYSDIDEDGNDLQKISVDNNLDGNRNFGQTVYGLDNNTDYFYKMCVEYEDEDGDQTLECGSTEQFNTDN